MTSSTTAVPMFKPWLAALAAGVAAASLAAQSAPGPTHLVPDLLQLLRAAIGIGWLVFVVLLLGQDTARLLRRSAPHTESLDAHWLPQGGARSQLQASSPSARSTGVSQGLSWRQTMRRAAIVSAVTLPRFASDPTGYAVASVWLLPLLVCGYVYIEAVWGVRRSMAYWIAAAAFLAPWGIRAVAVRWPPLIW